MPYRGRASGYLQQLLEVLKQIVFQRMANAVRIREVTQTIDDVYPLRL